MLKGICSWSDYSCFKQNMCVFCGLFAIFLSVFAAEQLGGGNVATKSRIGKLKAQVDTAATIKTQSLLSSSTATHDDDDDHIDIDDDNEDDDDDDDDDDQVKPGS